MLGLIFREYSYYIKDTFLLFSILNSKTKFMEKIVKQNYCFYRFKFKYLKDRERTYIVNYLLKNIFSGLTFHRNIFVQRLLEWILVFYPRWIESCDAYFSLFNLVILFPWFIIIIAAGSWVIFLNQSPFPRSKPQVWEP